MLGIKNQGIYYREDIDFIYVPITRCGSTWIRRTLEHNDFARYALPDHVTTEDVAELKNKTKLIILRDPLERLISGMYAPEEFDVDTIYYNKEKMFANFMSDVHTTPQMHFLRRVVLDKVIYINYENSGQWGANMLTLLNQMIPNFKGAPYVWEHVPGGTSPKHLLKVAKENETVYNNLMDYLKEDQEFFEQVKWHGTN